MLLLTCSILAFVARIWIFKYCWAHVWTDWFGAVNAAVWEKGVLALACTDRPWKRFKVLY
jgi:hypothetical protein